MTPYEEILETIRPEVSFGVTTIQVFRAGDLKSQQIGYSVSTGGKWLCLHPAGAGRCLSR
jgi:hypothetical protein